jgi:hypothetical protein
VAAPAPIPRRTAAASPLHAAIPPSAAVARAQIDRGEDGLAVVRAGSTPERAFASARMLLRTSKSAFRYGALLLLVAGLVAARGRPSQRAFFVAAIAAAYAVVLYTLTFSMGYVSRRHALPPLLPLFGYVGLGALAFGSWLANLSGRRRYAWLGRASPLAIGVSIAVLVAVGELATQREPRREEDGAARAAAEWLRDHRPSAPLATTRLRLGYYAGMPYVPLVRVEAMARESQLDEYLDQVGVRYLLLDDAEELEAVRRVEGERLTVLHSVRQGGREAWVFERVESPARSRP